MIGVAISSNGEGRRETHAPGGKEEGGRDNTQSCSSSPHVRPYLFIQPFPHQAFPHQPMHPPHAPEKGEHLIVERLSIFGVNHDA